MNEMDMIHTFKSMMMVAKQYDMEISSEYERLENLILEEHDLDVSDMMGSLEHVFQIVKKQIGLKDLFKFEVKDNFYQKTFKGEIEADSKEDAIKVLKEDYAFELGTTEESISVKIVD